MKGLIRNKKTVIAIIAVILVALIGFRILIINNVAEKINRQIFEVGEQVQLNGDFMLDKNENTVGYSVSMENSEHLTYLEMMKRYNLPEDYMGKENRFDVILLKLKVVNKDNETGLIYNKEFRVLNKWLNIDYGIDSILAKITEPALGDSPVFSIRPGTEYTITLPFSVDKKRVDSVNNIDVASESPYFLRVSAYPVEKVIEFNME